jgi:hypothetical protein
MTETWLHPNRRALWFGLIPALVFGGSGVALLVQSADTGGPWRWAGVAIVFVALTAIVTLLLQLRQPRIAFRDGHVLFNLQQGAPIAVPVEIIEAFFLSQGPAHLPAGIRQSEKTMNLVARLSQRHQEWKERDVKPALGSWAEGYVTIRGTWCEPLGTELIRRLNRRLKEVKSEETAPDDSSPCGAPCQSPV